jgi:hypothetical protein
VQGQFRRSNLTTDSLRGAAALSKAVPDHLLAIAPRSPSDLSVLLSKLEICLWYRNWCTLQDGRADRQEFLEHGFFSRVFPDRTSALAALKIAASIASINLFDNLASSQNPSVEEGLSDVRTLNGGLLQGLTTAVEAFLGKTKAVFPKLYRRRCQS